MRCLTSLVNLDAIEMHKRIANSKLAIIPCAHGEYIGEIMTLNQILKRQTMLFQ
jgi:hypothetical protein